MNVEVTIYWDRDDEMAGKDRFSVDTNVDGVEKNWGAGRLYVRAAGVLRRDLHALIDSVLSLGKEELKYEQENGKC